MRTHRKVSFLTLSDGSLPASQTLQAVLSNEVRDALKGELAVGQAVEVMGALVQSRGRGQEMEFKVDSVRVLGECDASVSTTDRQCNRKNAG